MTTACPTWWRAWYMSGTRLRWRGAIGITPACASNPVGTRDYFGAVLDEILLAHRSVWGRAWLRHRHLPRADHACGHCFVRYDGPNREQHRHRTPRGSL